MDLREFISHTDVMVITDCESDISHYLRYQNLSKGDSYADYLIITPIRMAEELVQAYEALYEPQQAFRSISKDMAVMLLHGIVHRTKFRSIPESSKGRNTSAEILRVLDEIRMNHPTGAFEEGDSVRASEMSSLIKEYETTLTAKQYLDVPMLFQRAVYCLKELERTPPGKNAICFLLPWVSRQIGVVDDIDLTSLEQDFLSGLEKCAGKTFENLTIPAKENTNRAEYHFFRSYGAAGEADHVIDEVRRKGLSFGEVMLLYPNGIYENLLRGKLDAAGFSYAFPRGTHAASEDYICFLLSMIDFAENDYDYRKLEKLITNPVCKLTGKYRSYRKVLREGIGWGKDRYLFFVQRMREQKTEEENGEQTERLAYVTFLEELIQVFSADPSARQLLVDMVCFAGKYTLQQDPVRIGIHEQITALQSALELAEESLTFSEKLSLIRDGLEELRFITAERPDAITICPYGDRMVTDRKYLFVLGLSGENIFGNIPESPVFSDRDLRRYASGPVHTAAEHNSRLQRNFERLLESFPGEAVYIGYSSYDTVGLIENTRSLLYTELMRRENVGEEQIRYVGYEPLKGRLYIKSEDVYHTYTDGVEDTEDEKEAPGLQEQQGAVYLSSSQLAVLMHCPLQYYYKKVEHIPEVNYQERTPDRWLGANQKGNLFHHTLEEYVNEVIIDRGETEPDPEAMERIFRNQTEAFEKEQPYSSEAVAEEEKEECKKAVERYIRSLHEELRNSPQKRILGCEVEFREYVYPESEDDKRHFRITLNGSADRVDGTVEEGILNLELIDYKTGNYDIKCREIDEGVQLQHYVYAMCIEDWGKKHIAELQKRLGTTITDCRVVSMKYIFPFAEDPEKSVIDASELVRDGRAKAGFSQKADTVLELTIGEMQQNGEEGIKKALEFMEYSALEKIGQDPEGHCKYCCYTNICRMRLGENRDDR